MFWAQVAGAVLVERAVALQDEQAHADGAVLGHADLRHVAVEERPGGGAVFVEIAVGLQDEQAQLAAAVRGHADLRHAGVGDLPAPRLRTGEDAGGVQRMKGTVTRPHDFLHIAVYGQAPQRG